MRISELIVALEKLLEKEGDVFVETYDGALIETVEYVRDERIVRMVT